MARRQFGSVRKLPSGRFQARYKHEGAEFLASETFATKADASAWLAMTQTDLLRGIWIDPSAGRETLSLYAKRWLEARSDLRPTTRAKYEHLLQRHILPKLGSQELARLTPSDVRSWYQSLARQHQVTSDDAYRLLRAILNTAVADNQLVKSPCTVKGAGSVRSPERPVASIAEVSVAVEAVPQRYRLALLLASWCQLRRGEVLALQRHDVDLLHGSIRIERALVLPLGGSLVLGPPKTAAGTRTLNVPPNIIPTLSYHLDHFVGPAPDAWLFSTETGGPLLPRTLDQVWGRARKAAGIADLHFHDLWHSGLTWAAATGASVPELMRRGGHANPQAALRYQHATEERDKALAEAMAKLPTMATVVPLRVGEHGQGG